MVVRVERPAVVVDAEEANIEVVARELEVVGIAAERGHVPVRREDEAYVGIFLVAVEIVARAAEKGDDVAREPGAVERFLLDRGGRGAQLCLGFVWRCARLERGLHAVGDVLGALQDHHFEALAVELVAKSGRVEAVFLVVVRACAEGVELAFADVAIGDDEAVGGDERAGATADFDDGATQMIEPCRVEREVVFVGNGLLGRIVEKPIAFVGVRGRGANKEQDAGKNPDHQAEDDAGARRGRQRGYGSGFGSRISDGAGGGLSR